VPLETPTTFWLASAERRHLPARELPSDPGARSPGGHHHSSVSAPLAELDPGLAAQTIVVEVSTGLAEQSEDLERRLASVPVNSVLELPDTRLGELPWEQYVAPSGMVFQNPGSADGSNGGSSDEAPGDATFSQPGTGGTGPAPTRQSTFGPTGPASTGVALEGRADALLWLGPGSQLHASCSNWRGLDRAELSRRYRVLTGMGLQENAAIDLRCDLPYSET
jgi:hypothetical protein